MQNGIIKNKFFIFNMFLLLFFMSGYGYANNLYTAKGKTVNHTHSTSTIGGDVDFEKRNGFSFSNRLRLSTDSYNCHGRTFANRTAWVDFADPYIRDATGMSVYPPKMGDVIVWYDSSGKTSHTVTVSGSWDGVNTIVTSKYGRMGEYRHALSNVLKVYKDWYTYYRLPGTPVYYKQKTQGNVYSKSAKEVMLDSRLIVENEYEPILAKLVDLTKETKKILSKLNPLMKR